MRKIYLFIIFLLFAPMLMAQITITGKITDDEGAVLPGVSIAEKGTNNGTVSDNEGNYSLSYSGPKSILVFSLNGFMTQEILPVDKVQLDVKLLSGLELNNVEIVGSRNLKRTSTDTPVPVDIIDIKKLTNSVGQLDINQVLQFSAPSFNSNKQSGSDGADHIDPATLRGLGPDQTLVLINGKRRHQSSLINIYGTRGRGNTGTDLNAIPMSAIDHIEILRDGASAQYGSDAIASVINIVLKSNVDEFTGGVSYGAYGTKSTSDVVATDKYDGQNLQFQGNYGVGIGKGGFLNFSFEYLDKAHTNRPADPTKFDIYRREFGDAASQDYKSFYNLKIPIGENAEIYSFGAYSNRYTQSYAWTRFADDDRNIPEMYPNGFDPNITSRIGDKSISAGFRAHINGWDVDVNNTFGSNRFHYMIDGTLNTSLLSNSPTRFDAGGHQFSQNTTSISFSKLFDVMSGINLAMGTEYRIDNYQIFAGEEASYRNYGIVDSVTPAGFLVKVDKLGLAAGSQGFPGFQPANELNEYRSNSAFYLDAEFDFTKSFMAAAAIRYENYSDFGNTFNGKLALRYSFTPNIAIRASLSNGFRAPSLAQSYYNTTFTDVVGGVIIDKLIARNNSPITNALGIPRLKEEKATNASAGITAKLGSFTATIDGYYVDIKNRIVLTGAFEDTDAEIGSELQKLGVGAAQFFTNAIDTKTTGLDIILSYNISSGPHNFTTMLAGNFNKMELGTIHVSPKLAGKEDIYFGSREQHFLLASAPPMKLNLSLDYRYKKFDANIRAVYFDKVTLINWDDAEDVYDSRYVLDLTLGYKITKNLQWNIGASNLLNAYPTRQDPGLTEAGGLWDAVQMGFDGRFLFTKLLFKF